MNELKLKKYLIIPTFNDDYEELSIILAKNIKEARKIFSYQQGLKDSSFIEDLHEKSINMSFAEKFWSINEEEINRAAINGDINSDDEEKFKNNVRLYFIDVPEYAELFINYYFMPFEELNECYRFPDEMIQYIYHKDFDEKDWKIIDLNKIPILKESSHGSEISDDNIVRIDRGKN